MSLSFLHLLLCLASEYCCLFKSSSDSLATEYHLKLVYKKTFNEVLQEEQGSRDFGPLLSKMGVINAEGESAMTPDQWEAASELDVCRHHEPPARAPEGTARLTTDLYMAFAFQKI